MPSLMELLGDIGYAVDTPGAYARGLLAARPGERVSGRELFGLEEGTGNEILGLLAEIGLDPLNLLSAGGAGVATAALPLLAMSKLDKAGDLGRAGLRLEDLLKAGHMPESLARETLFSRRRMHPKAGVDPSEIVDALTEAVPEFEKYRSGRHVIDEEVLAEMAALQLEAPFHPKQKQFAANRRREAEALSNYESSLEKYGQGDELAAELDDYYAAGGSNAYGGWYPHEPPRPVSGLAERFLSDKAAGGDDVDKAIEVIRRLASEDGRESITNLRQVADEDKLSALVGLFDEAIEPVTATHITKSPKNVVETVRDLLTPGANLPTSATKGVGDQWMGQGVYVGAEGNPLPPYLAGLKKDNEARVLEGLVHMKNPVVMPHARYYDEAGLQRFIKDNPDLFDIPAEHYSKVHPESLRYGEEGYDEGAEAWQTMVQDADEGSYYAHPGNAEGGVYNAEHFDEIFGTKGEQLPEGFQVSASNKHNIPVEFTNAAAADIVRHSGYDAVIPASQSLWIDDLFEPANAVKYKEFREAVLSDPSFWHEVSLMYPEEASRYLGDTETFQEGVGLSSAGFKDPRVGDPVHGQLFLPGEIIPEEMMAAKGSVPPEDIQKALLVAIGVGGMSEVLKSMEKNREVAA